MLTLLDTLVPSLEGFLPQPEGFRYEAEVISAADERELLGEIEQLKFKTVVFRGTEARRRVAQFGWDYDFTARQTMPADPIPPFLLSLRNRAGDLAGVDPKRLEEVLVTEYDPGAGIGWHRDAPPFGEVVGISLMSSCKFKLRRLGPDAGDVVTVALEPRSAYVIAGEARTSWQHSIPPTKHRRYSVTFRTIRHEGA